MLDHAGDVLHQTAAGTTPVPVEVVAALGDLLQEAARATPALNCGGV